MRFAFLKARGVSDVPTCVNLAPFLLALSTESIDAKRELLRDYGLDPTHMLQTCPQFFGINSSRLEEKLRFAMGALRLTAFTLEHNPTLLNRSLDGNMRPRIALLLQLGLPLPPPPAGADAADEPRGRRPVTLLTVLRWPTAQFLAHLVESGHPSVFNADDLEEAAGGAGLLAAAKEWEEARVAEAVRMGLVPETLSSDAAAREVR